MLPTFPLFKRLELSDRTDVEAFVSNFAPFSDFNFLSMWSYDTEGKCEVCQLNGNLVVIFSDYLSKQPFFSFIGNKNTLRTMHTLIKEAKNRGYSSKLKLLPDISIEGNKMEIHKKFNLVEDRDNFDYIYKTSNMAALRGHKYDDKRKYISRFVRAYPEYEVRTLSLSERGSKLSVLKLFETWSKNSNKTKDDVAVEREALRRFIGAAADFDILTVGIYVGGTLVAFGSFELGKLGFAIAQFGKSDESYVGSSKLMIREGAALLQKNGFEYVNYEQDLGIPGLRTFKKSWQPVSFLKKFIVSPTN